MSSYNNDSLALGANGFRVIKDTSAYTGEWYAITVINDAVFTTLTSSFVTGDITSLTLSAGTTIYGNFTAITLASGAVIAYKV